MNHLDIAKAQLKIDEGVREKAYKDTVGKLTIGVGRNLDDVGLRPDEIDYLLTNDIAQAENDAVLLVGDMTFNSLTVNRKAVLVNMAFNLGFRRLSQFVETLRHIKSGAFHHAAEAMMDSTWAKQVGSRAERLAKLMKDG